MSSFERLGYIFAFSILFSVGLVGETPTVDEDFQPTWNLPETGLAFDVYENQLLATISNSKGIGFRAKIDTGSPFTLIDRSLLEYFEHYETDRFLDAEGINGFATSIDTSMKTSNFRVVRLKNIFVMAFASATSKPASLTITLSTMTKGICYSV